MGHAEKALLFPARLMAWFGLKDVPMKTWPWGPGPAGRWALTPVHWILHLFPPLLCLQDPPECPGQLDEDWKP